MPFDASLGDVGIVDTVGEVDTIVEASGLPQPEKEKLGQLLNELLDAGKEAEKRKEHLKDIDEHFATVIRALGYSRP